MKIAAGIYFGTAIAIDIWSIKITSSIGERAVEEDAYYLRRLN
jgi:hypothetical protein